MKFLKEEINIFFIALSFFTRVPFPKFAKFTQDYQHKSIKYFSLVGIIIGLFCAFIFFASNFIFPKIISILLTYIAGVLLTGALHEDGFADVCDGFGGGWTKERILEIMKDSLVGVYGIVGLICLILIKISCYWVIDSTFLPIVIIASHSFSRFVATTIVNTHQYARIGNSKAKDMVKPISFFSLLIAFVFAIIPILFFNNIFLFTLIILPYLSKIILARFFNKYIGGFTGDCIGSIQIISELLFLLSYILYQNKIVEIVGELKIIN